VNLVNRVPGLKELPKAQYKDVRKVEIDAFGSTGIGTFGVVAEAKKEVSVAKEAQKYRIAAGDPGAWSYIQFAVAEFNQGEEFPCSLRVQSASF